MLNNHYNESQVVRLDLNYTLGFSSKQNNPVIMVTNDSMINFNQHVAVTVCPRHNFTLLFVSWQPNHEVSHGPEQNVGQLKSFEAEEQLPPTLELQIGVDFAVCSSKKSYKVQLICDEFVTLLHEFLDMIMLMKVTCFDTRLWGRDF